MDIKMEVRGKEQLSAFVRSVHRDQIPFTTSSAINATAIKAQRAQREHMEDMFTVRRPRFTLRGVKIKPFARKKSLEARVWIDPPGGASRADILTKFEKGGTKRARDGGSIAIPGEGVRRTGAGVIRKDQRPRRLIQSFDMKPVGRDRVFSMKGTGVWAGRRRSFMIRTSGGGGGIFQRTGKGPDDLKVLYRFRPSVEIEPDLEFIETVTGVVKKEFDTEFHKAWMRAIRTAR